MITHAAIYLRETLYTWCTTEAPTFYFTWDDVWWGCCAVQNAASHRTYSIRNASVIGHETSSSWKFDHLSTSFMSRLNSELDFVTSYQVEITQGSLVYMETARNKYRRVILRSISKEMVNSPYRLKSETDWPKLVRLLSASVSQVLFLGKHQHRSYVPKFTARSVSQFVLK